MDRNRLGSLFCVCDHFSNVINSKMQRDSRTVEYENDQSFRSSMDRVLELLGRAEEIVSANHFENLEPIPIGPIDVVQTVPFVAPSTFFSGDDVESYAEVLDPLRFQVSSLGTSPNVNSFNKGGESSGVMSDDRPASLLFPVLSMGHGGSRPGAWQLDLLSRVDDSLPLLLIGV